MSSKIEAPKFADLCQDCDKSFIGLYGSTKWCPYCGAKHEGDHVAIEFAAPVVEHQPVSVGWIYEDGKEFTRCADHAHDLMAEGIELTPVFACLDKLKDLNS